MSNLFKFNPALHGLRCIAAMAVLIFHWGQFFPGGMQWLAQFQYPGHPWVNLSLPLALGSQGVTLFFVLSGFLLTSQWIGRPITKRWVLQFYLRRAVRILPAFWFQLAVLLGLAYVLPQVFKMPSPEHVALTGMLWINLPPAFVPPINDVWWTLPVEMLFYVVLPLLLFLERKVGLAWVWAGVLTATFAWRGAVMTHFMEQNLSQHFVELDALPGILSVFLSGMVMALLLQKIPVRLQKYLLWVAITLFILLQTVFVYNIQVYWQVGFMLLVWNTLLSITFALAVGALCSRITHGWLGSRPMIWLGDLSFGIYLWHFPLMLIAHTYWPTLGQGALASGGLLVGILAATLLIASLSYYTIERPLTQLVR